MTATSSIPLPCTHPPVCPPPSDVSFEELYTGAACGLLTMTPEGTVLTINDTVLALCGILRRTALGGSVLRALTRGSQLLYETRCLPVLRLTGELREVALTIIRADGTELAVLVNAVTVNGLVRVAVFDSTARQVYERELLQARRAAERSESRVRALKEASMSFGGSRDEQALAEELVRIARQTLTATDVAVLLLDRDADGALRLIAGTDPLDGKLEEGTSRPRSDAISTARVVVVSSLVEARATYPEAADALEEVRREALCAVPLVGDNDLVIGVLVCYFGRSRRLDDDDIELQEALARQAAEALGRIRLQEELTRLALHDPLTGLANRQLLHNHLGFALIDALHAGRALSLIFLDLDGFKAVNDGLGHHSGDAVLQQISARLTAAVRQHDIVGRFGGDEFVAICEDAGFAESALLAERIRAAACRELDGVPARYYLSASVGVAVFDPKFAPAPSAAAFIARADAAMYDSKRAGRNRVTVVAI